MKLDRLTDTRPIERASIRVLFIAGLFRGQQLDAFGVAENLAGPYQVVMNDPYCIGSTCLRFDDGLKGTAVA